MKVAVCLVGIVGGHTGKHGEGDPKKVLEIGYKHYKQFILDNNDCDVFCHSATTEMADDIIKLYKPKEYLFIEQPNFDIPDYVTGAQDRKEAHYHKWFSHKKVSELRQIYEGYTNTKYDMVYVGRYDICWTKDIVFKEFNPDNFYLTHWNRLYRNGVEIKGAEWYNSMNDDFELNYDGVQQAFVGYPHNDEGVMDSWFFSNPEYMDILCSLYDSLDEYTKPGVTWWDGKSTVVDGSGNISNHRLIPKHLEVNGILDKLKHTFCVHDDFPLVRRLYYKSRI